MIKIPLLINFLFCSIILNAQDLKESQIFTINHQRDTILVGKDGTQIVIPKSNFDISEALLDREPYVKIKLVEAYSVGDMALSNLSTITKDGVLESNGMISVEAYYDNNKVALKQDASLNISMPASSGISKMELYELENPNSAIWVQSSDKVKLDTCKNYRKEIIWDNKKVKKKEYKEWDKSTPASERPQERLFGGTAINITFPPRIKKKAYFIPVPIDTIWICNDKETSHYYTSITQLGWKNIDKLRKTKNPVKVEVITEENLEVFLIVNRIKVCLKSQSVKGINHEFRAVEKGNSITIIAYKRINNESMKFQSIKTNAKDGEIRLEKASVISMEEFYEKMKELR